jgi:hypothetical protein
MQIQKEKCFEFRSSNQKQLANAFLKKHDFKDWEPAYDIFAIQEELMGFSCCSQIETNDILIYFKLEKQLSNEICHESLVENFLNLTGLEFE